MNIMKNICFSFFLSLTIEAQLSGELSDYKKIAGISFHLLIIW